MDQNCCSGSDLRAAETRQANNAVASACSAERPRAMDLCGSGELAYGTADHSGVHSQWSTNDSTSYDYLPRCFAKTIAAHYAAAMMEYQVFNTAFWDVVEPSLQFEGAYKSMDRLQLKEFMNDDLRDGVGLYNYVRELTDVNQIDKRIEAMQALAAHGKLSADARVTLVQIDKHSNGLLAKWLDVHGNGATIDVVDFRTRLVASLPDEPFSSKIVNIRMHLIDLCNATQTMMRRRRHKAWFASSRSGLVSSGCQQVRCWTMSPLR